MSAVEEVTTPAPASQFAGTAQEFLSQVSYDTSTRAQRRARGDHALLARLQEQLGNEGLLSSLRSDQAEDAIEMVEASLWGEWRLSGDDSTPILERLDAHLLPAQETWVAHRAQQAEANARLAQQRSVEALNELRGWIGLHRQRVTEGQELIKHLEADLAAKAEALGVLAWPQ
jgi:hypothetical protein